MKLALAGSAEFTFQLTSFACNGDLRRLDYSRNPLIFLT